MEHLAGTHDLKQLPEWGPYTKKYIGISHLADVEKGLRFDLSVFPGFYRRKVDVPNVMWESGYHPWEAAPDVSWFTHRHELEWKDRVYADISYAALSTESRLVRCELVNRTEHEQNLILHYMASLHFPQVRGHGGLLQPVRPMLPDKAKWTDALDYEELEFATPRPTDNLVYDGFLRGEVRGQHLVGGSGLGAGFGTDAGDRVQYRIKLADSLENAVLLVRYRMEEGSSLMLHLGGLCGGKVQLAGTGQVETASVHAGAVHAGEHMVSFESDGGAGMILDGFTVVERDTTDRVQFMKESTEAHPQILQGPVANSLLLKYDGVDQYYGLLWCFDDYEVREFHCDELDRFMRHNVHHHVQSVFKGQGEGHFTNVFLRPIPMEPQSNAVLYGMICCGGREEVEQRLASFDQTAERCEERFETAKRGTAAVPSNPSGEPYRFSQQLMQATTVTNVVYPVYTKRSYIRHNTPGRWWDSLYTWDSGFIGLGLAELDIQRAVECLNAYVTEPGDPHAAFIHHGSMVPVQHYLFLELWNKTQSRELLDYFYPRLRQYYLFYAGKLGSSTTRTLKSGLLMTWDYFYNSGGWDDYPPQVETHRRKLTAAAAPVSNTSHGIRIAKILVMAATAIGGLEDDIAEYHEDIDAFSTAVQTNAWDEEAGYFGYVLHNAQGEPSGLLRHETGQNYNMGLDGAYPLVADICTPEQERRLLGHINDSNRLWSRIGLSAVDQSAAYYKKDGYWNGAVWMPHQWFYWKTLLSLGYPEPAHRIARTALDLWKNEVEKTYNCYEHFIIQSGRGAGWHHFGGLSAPVLNWFASYHRPGTLTCGYDVWLDKVEFRSDHTGLSAELRYFGSLERAHTLLVCLKAGKEYRVTWNGRAVEGAVGVDGVIEIRLQGDRAGKLKIQPV
jgi:hypothetical protein